MTEYSPGPGNTPIRINIVLVCLEDIRYGAAIAAYRLYTGLRVVDPNTRMLVKHKHSKNPDVIPVFSSEREVAIEAEALSDRIHQKCIINNRTAVSTTYFSYPIFGYDFERSTVLTHADVINLHWIDYFCSLASLKKIAGLKKPIVWTLHDQWLFTGGCHYTSGCDNYLNDCMHCPQLKKDEKLLPHSFLEKKRELIREMNPVIVTPSNWLADIVKRNPVFQNARVEVIPNSVDTDLYTNIPKETARKQINLPPQGFYLLFSVSNAFEKRKGTDHLIAALRICMEDPIFSNKVMTGELKLVSFGDPGTWTNDDHLPCISLGWIGSESDLCTVYSAADVFLVPSIEDNLPNTVIEAMCCGTPTIAFDTGGIPEMIQNGVNGYIVKNKSESEYAKVILDLVNDKKHCAQMSKNCRAMALNTFSLKIQAKRYLDLYCSLVPANGGKTDGLTFSMSQFDHDFLPDASDINNEIKRYFPMQVIAMEIKIVLRTTKRLLESFWQHKRAS